MMTEKRKNVRVLALALALSLGLSSLQGYADTKQEIADSKQEIKDSEEKISSLEDERAKVQDTISDLESLKADTKAYVTKLDQQLETLSNEIEGLAVDIADKEQKIVVTQEELVQAQAVEAEQYASMKLRIKYMYEKGDTNFIDMILTAESWSELLNRAEYISKISEYDRRKLDEYEATREAIAAHEAKLEQEHAELIALKESTEAKQESVQRLVDEKQKEIAAYNERISAAEGQVNEINAAIREQENSIAAMEAEIKRKEEEARKAAEEAGKTYTQRTLSGGMVWPCPSSSRVTSYFGERESPTEGASTSHKGIDIGAPTGAAVVAAAAGEVVIATYSVSAGNYVMINHGSGVYTVYMHMSSIAVSVGQEVSQGQKVGAVGSTGYSTGPHLHFGVRKNGSYVDPFGYM